MTSQCEYWDSKVGSGIPVWIFGLWCGSWYFIVGSGLSMDSEISVSMLGSNVDSEIAIWTLMFQSGS